MGWGDVRPATPSIAISYRKPASAALSWHWPCLYIGYGDNFAMDVSALTFTQTEFQPQVGRSVSIEQAAQLLGVSRRTVYYRIRDGRLRTIRTIGGSQRVLMDSVEEMRAAH
jgi:excisionase family DNA binding protein